MNWHYWTNHDRRIARYILLLILALWLVILFFGQAAWQNRRDSQQLTKQIVQLQKAIPTKQQRTDYIANQRALHNSNSGIRTSSRQLVADHKATITANKLFPALLDFNSSAQYNSRKKRAKPYVTTNVLKAQFISQSDYTLGNHFIDTSQMHSQFQSLQLSTGILKGAEIPVVINATSNNWWGGENKGQIQELYTGTYNYRINKFTNLQPVNTLKVSQLND